MASLKNRLGCALGVAGALVVFVLFVLSVARTVKTGDTAPSSSAAAAEKPGEEAKGARALLDGLRPGDSLAGWRVLRTRYTADKRLALDVERDHSGFTVWVGRKGADKRQPPEQTDRYDLYFGKPWGKKIPDDAETKVLGEVAVRVRRTEKTAPTPPGIE